MIDVTYDANMYVLVKDSMGDDKRICDAARVSTLGDKADAEIAAIAKDSGLVNYLMRNRHGSPFEHGAITFIVTTPIFVWREHMRHRIGFSYNEESGRYKELEPRFYMPRKSRTQTGKPGHYVMASGSIEQDAVMMRTITMANSAAYAAYRNMLDAGIAREVARMPLPINIYSTAYVTCNPRSLMNFLSLRVDSPDATVPSKPQAEINMVADQYEEAFKRIWPATHAAFVSNGRIAP